MKQCADPVYKSIVFTICFINIICNNYLNFSFAENVPVVGRFEIPSSPNPVGSGARALGMGGAFIAVADDATAASWNPGGFMHLTRPEISFVGASFHRIEDNSFGINPEASGNQSVSDISVNYLSATYPFVIRDYKMVVSVNYQNLYDFNREWIFSMRYSDEYHQNIDYNYDLSGSLSALGIAYSVLINPEFSLGFTLNFWEDGLNKNEWEEKWAIKSSGTTLDNRPFTRETYSAARYSFSGFNVNLGMLWNVGNEDKLFIGAVLKTPFKADLKREQSFRSVVSRYPDEDDLFSYSLNENETMDMPMSYGLGLAYRFSDELTAAIDIYRTEWDDFVLRDYTGRETSPITGKPASESEIDPTHQIRIGAEYLISNENKTPLWWQIHEVPIRCGIFYDPAPAEGSPDNFFGLSFGSGFLITERFSFDMAYQYRFGRDVGTSILKNREFSQDVDEHTVYSSIIIYF